MLIDLATRGIVGWATSASMATALPLLALQHAAARRQPAPGLIHHTPTALKSVPFGKCGDHPNCLTTPVAARSAACLALPKRGVYGTSMARTVKMTFTLDQDTSARIDRTALRLGIPKSAVVREAVAEYAARAGRTSEQDRLLMLSVFDDLLARIPLVPAESADPELAALRRARQSGGRSTPAARKK